VRRQEENGNIGVHTESSTQRRIWRVLMYRRNYKTQDLSGVVFLRSPFFSRTRERAAITNAKSFSLYNGIGVATSLQHDPDRPVICVGPGVDKKATMSTSTGADKNLLQQCRLLGCKTRRLGRSEWARRNQS